MTEVGDFRKAAMRHFDALRQRGRPSLNDRAFIASERETPVDCFLYPVALRRKQEATDAGQGNMDGVTLQIQDNEHAFVFSPALIRQYLFRRRQRRPETGVQGFVMTS